MERIDPLSAGERHTPPAAFADRGSAALEELRVGRHRPLGPQHTGVLLVGEEGQHQGTAWQVTGPQPPPDDGEHGGDHVLHVDGAAAPDPAVGDLTGQGRHRPVRGLRRDDVEVHVDEQRVEGRVGTGHPGNDGASPWLGLDKHRRQPVVGEPAGHPLGRRALTGTADLGVQPDEVRQ